MHMLHDMFDVLQGQSVKLASCSLGTHKGPGGGGGSYVLTFSFYV